MDSKVHTNRKTHCYHCGEPCGRSPVLSDEKSFCCTGCKTVYELLDEHDMGTYYCLEEKPGISFQQDRIRNRYDYLDDPSLVKKLIDFENDDFISVTLYIPNIHCTSCVWLLENLYKLDKGITKSSVNFLKREISVSFDRSKTNLRNLVELLASIGYEPELRLDNLDDNSLPASRPDRKLWLKLGVAGFAFGNIMLFSFPEYLSGSTLNSQGSFHTFFGILNIVLALPVVLYSSIDYLKSAWAALRQKGINLDVPISLGILALFTRSIYEITTGIGAGYMDSLTGLVFFLLIGRMIQKKTYQRLAFDRDYKSYLPISVSVLQDDGTECTRSIDKLEEGTSILIRNQELVPADACLHSERCYIDYSFITGESDPVEVQEGDTVYAGGRVIGGSATMTTLKEVSASYLTRLWNNAAFDESEEQPTITTLADTVSPYFTVTVLLIAVVSGLLWLPSGTDMAITVFSAVLIIACPCALALSTPFTLGGALNIFSRNGLYIKGIEVIERLAKTSSIVFDKTGTLTDAASAQVTFHGSELSEGEKRLIKSATEQSLHPLSKKIAAYMPGPNGLQVESFDETLNRGIRTCIENRTLLIGSASFIEQHLGKDSIEASYENVPASTVHVAIDSRWKGRFEIASKQRNGIGKLLPRIKEKFNAFLITGDNDTQKEAFESYFGESSLRFNQTPQQKLDFVKELQSADETVLMIGDGLNDAGALKQSDFGIALTDDVTSFTPACDAILEGAYLKDLDSFIDFSKASMNIIKLSFVLSLLYNVIGLSFAVAGELSPLVAAILMPLSSISIMIFTTFGTHLAANKTGLRSWK